ncbi:MAG: molybdopterin-dependent oxidoreductase [Magnetococcales bacterium]|nr:molybdopterin-dependent oxidoreductase [Magnetococcales bacterium]NGZ06049.1 molybdopterin-dependent oxidoreductase [Magnetococcales bacterium]
MNLLDRSVSRRRFLQAAGAAGFGVLAAPGGVMAGYRFLAPTQVENPLAAYPSRDWERIYRDVFRHDKSFVFMCCPNDTHNCLLNAYVKNDVVVRIEPTYGYGKAQDLYGNQATHRWDPRCCQKGLILARRFYGDRRVNGAFVRKGFKQWADKGFPRDDKTGAAPKELMRRGWDSWVKVTHEEAAAYHARALYNIAKTYSGEQGKKYLLAQGYDPDMVTAAGGAGTRVTKFRGGMAMQGAVRIFGAFRMGNSMALLDKHLRNVTDDEAKGSGSWDSYSFHTDLPPGHPMVTGDQTNDFELFDAENSRLIISWGMNWISTKMPDGHWLTEARLKGAKTVAVTVEYSSTANKCDDVLVIRPGTDPAFALGLAQVILAEKLFDDGYVKRFTDLPTLVRMDNLERLKAVDLFGGKNSTMANWTQIIPKGEKAPPTPKQQGVQVPEALVGDFNDFVVWDAKSNQPRAVTHDQMGKHFEAMGIDPALTGTFEVTLADGKKVQVRTVLDLTRQYLDANMTPEQVQKISWAPANGIRSLARDIGAAKGATLFATGMGPNQFWNNDNKDRAIMLVAALTGNLGRHGGNVGSYAGVYKNTLFSGVPRWTLEDPFNPQLDPNGPIKIKPLLRPESMHYWANGERVMKAGNKKITAGGHMPTPTKAIWQVNSNSSLGNQKGHYDVVFNTLPKSELVVYNDWWWTASCEYSDIVYGVDSWVELKQPDMTGSNTNPFIQAYPTTPLKRIFKTISDNETYMLVARELAKLTKDDRFNQMWKYIAENRADVYLQRIIDGSTPLKGYRFEGLENLAKQGIPALMNTRTYPRINSYEQVEDSHPWFTKTGRLEFYRPEIEFIEAGENLIVYREPSDATFHEPCAIVAAPHPAIAPKGLAQWGIDPQDRSHQTRQMRNVVMTVDEVLASKHPLHARGWTYIFHTPKYRHGAHTTPIDTDFMSVLFGPFGDMYRRDKRTPSVGEMYVDIHPEDAKSMGIQDGDYVYVDGDPNDLPFRGWNDPKRKDEYKVARLLCRARYYPGTPRGVTRMWFNGYMATPGSVKAHESRPDGLAKNAETNYQSLFRYGGHQSLTRSWLKPTHQTQTLITRKSWTHEVTKGFNVDVHCVTNAPRESIAKFTKAEDGGIGGKGMWRPAALGLRPANESAAMKQYLVGGFVTITKT